jgi:hypothetical protein
MRTEDWQVKSDAVYTLSQATSLQTLTIESIASSALITVPSRVSADTLQSLTLIVVSAMLPGIGYIGKFMRLRNLRLALHTATWPEAACVP